MTIQDTPLRARIDAGITDAQFEIARLQADALAVALHARNLAHGVKMGIYAPGDPIVRAAEESASRALKALDQARGRLRHLEREEEQAHANAQARAALAEGERRRQWVYANRPDLVEAVAAAERAELDLRASPYWHDSPSGQAEMAATRRRVAVAKAALDAAATAAPAAEAVPA